ncbi:MAG TPA: helix-turn-helix domain-containing protein [Clostridiaceae bacterium]
MNTAFYPINNEENGLPFVVSGIGTHENQCHIVRNEGYNLHQIIFCIKGEGLLKTNGKEYCITEGTYFYLKPLESHEYYKVTDSWETNWILFTGENINNSLIKLDFSFSKIGSFQNSDNIRNQFNDILNTLKSYDSFRGFIASNQLYRLLIELYRFSNQEIGLNSTQDTIIIEPVINYINLHFSEDISLDFLATIVNVTPQHLCKVFKKRLYMRPFEYIAKKRIQESKKLLISGNMTIKDIGQTVGYKDNSYFCAMFKKYESISPSDFRGSIK